MTPFKIKLDSKESIFDQIVFAATKAILSGAMKLDDAFPSVRALAVDLKIHPNTAHKVVQYLIQERWLNTRPGKGTTVALPPKPRSGDKHRLLNHEIEQLVVEARRVGVNREEVIKSIEQHWKSLERLKAVSNDN